MLNLIGEEILEYKDYITISDSSYCEEFNTEEENTEETTEETPEQPKGLMARRVADGI